MIEPTPGRIVWFYPDVNDGRTLSATGPRPLAAIVARVIHERCVNLTVSREDGTTFGAQNVTLLQDGFTLSDAERAYAEWMPFQKGQAARFEAAKTEAPATAASATAPAPAAPAADLEPVHAKIDAVIVRVEQALSAQAPDLQPLHDKIDAIAKDVEAKLQEFGGWTVKTFEDLRKRVASIAEHPALNNPFTQVENKPSPNPPETTAIGASTEPGANLTAEGAAATQQPA